MPGQMSVAHKRRYVDDYKAHAEIMASRFGYPHITFMDANETAERLGSTHYFGGTRDTGTGHIHPLKLVIGTARVAAQAGAQLFETDAVDRHHVQRRQGEGDDADGHDHRRKMPDRASTPMAAISSR